MKRENYKNRQGQEKCYRSAEFPERQQQHLRSPVTYGINDLHSLFSQCADSQSVSDVQNEPSGSPYEL